MRQFAINEIGPVSSMASLSVKPNTKTLGRLTIAKSIAGSPIEMPFAIIRGARDGPKIWVQGVIHGDEFVGSETVRRIINDLNPETLSGTLIGIPIVSTTAYAAHMRYSSIDHKDFDFSFTNNPSGTFTERFSHLILREITSMLSAEDFMFDLHGSPGGTIMQPWVDYHAIGGKSEERSKAAAEATGMRVVYKITPRKDYKDEIGMSTTFADEYLPNSSAMQILKRVKLGRLVIEAGSTVVRNEDVIVQYSGVLNVMKHLGMLKGSPTKPAGKRVYVNHARRVMAKNTGFWRPVAVPGNMVSKGEVLAVVTDEYGRKTEEAISPVDGILLINKPNSFVDPLSYVLGHRYGALVAY
jgi:predicted deacylase